MFPLPDPARLRRGNMARRVREGEHVLGGWLDQIRLG